MGSHAFRSRDQGAMSVMVALRRIVRFLRLADREAEAAHGLSAAQLYVLHSLAGHPAGSLAELAARTVTDQSSVSTVVARLAKLRLVSRTPSTKDRRRAELTLTPAGERVVRTAPLVPQARIVDAVRAMPGSRRRQVVSALDHLVVAIGANALEPRMLFEDEPVSARTKRKRR